MSMPERSFGRTVRYRRTKLGLSQTKLGELVGRSASTIRAWERDANTPNDPKVLSALAAILAVDERHLFEKAGSSVPEVETSPTVEQALATLAPPNADPSQARAEIYFEEELGTEAEDVSRPDREPRPWEKELAEAAVASAPAYVAPPDPFVRTPPTPNLTDVSYIEDESQRQLYRVRSLATLVAFVALVIAFIWGLGESVGAFGDWWDEFFGNLRL